MTFTFTFTLLLTVTISHLPSLITGTPIPLLISDGSISDGSFSDGPFSDGPTRQLSTCSSYHTIFVSSDEPNVTPSWLPQTTVPNTKTSYPVYSVPTCTILDFGYLQSNYHVVRVDERAYETCDLPAISEGGIGGVSPLPLDKDGTVLYTVEQNEGVQRFTCPTSNHCERGMKVQVNVVKPDVLWGWQGGSTESDIVGSVALDQGTSDVVVVGATRGNLVTSERLETHLGRGDCYVTKLNGVTGTEYWSTMLASVREERCVGVAVSRTGDVLVIGQTEEGVYSNDSMGRVDAFVARLAANGVEIEHGYIGGIGVDYATDVAVLKHGQVAALIAHSDSDHRLVGDDSGYGGDFTARVYLFDALKEITEGSVCVAEEGCAWMREFGTTEGTAGTEADSDAGVGTAVFGRDVEPRKLLVGTRDGHEILYVVGVTAGSGAIVGGDGHPSTFTRDSFVTTLNATDGTIIDAWRSNEENGDVVASSVCVDSLGDLIVVGWREDVEEKSKVGFVKKLKVVGDVVDDGKLVEVWSREMRAEEGEDAIAVDCAVSPDRKIMVVGDTSGLMEFAGINKKMGGQDLWYAELDEEFGALAWGRQMGTSRDERVGNRLSGRKEGGVVGDMFGNWFVHGATGGGLTGRNLGNEDLFVMKGAKDGDDYVEQMGGSWDALQKAVDAPSEGGGKGKGLGAGGVAGIAVAGVLVLVCGFVVGQRRTEAKYSKLMTEIIPSDVGGESKTARISDDDL